MYLIKSTILIRSDQEIKKNEKQKYKQKKRNENQGRQAQSRPKSGNGKKKKKVPPFHVTWKGVALSQPLNC